MERRKVFFYKFVEFFFRFQRCLSFFSFGEDQPVVVVLAVVVVEDVVLEPFFVLNVEGRFDSLPNDLTGIEMIQQWNVDT